MIFPHLRHQACAFVAIACVACLPIAAQVQTNVTTNRFDTSRSGQYLSENLLNYNNVNSTQFGKVASYPVDGEVYTQPLYLAGLYIPGSGRHNVIFIATEHDSVYAYDADNQSSTPLWHVSFINPAAGITTVPNTDVNSQQIVPEMGITCTPVIDPNTNTIYIEAYTKEVVGSNTNYVHRLHALDVTSGAEKPNSPVLIQPSFKLNGTTVTFNGKLHKPRMGLLLLNGIVYVGFASHSDYGPYHGWLTGYDATTLAQIKNFSTTITGTKAGLWQGNGGPVADTNGNIFVMSGNGDWDGTYNFGESFIKLSTAGTGLKVADFFTPHNYASLNNGDVDVGSGGPLLLPDTVGSSLHQHLITGAGKEGTLYLVDRDNMGKYQSGSDTQIVQSIPDAVNGYNYGTPSFFNGIIYIGAAGDILRGFQIQNGMINPVPVTSTSKTFFYPGAQTTVSANGTANGIVWFLENSNTSDWFTQGPAILHAFKAGDLNTELYNSTMNQQRDGLDTFVKFSLPTVAQGRVYVGTWTTLSVFGILAPTCATDVSTHVSVSRGAVRSVATGQFQQTIQLTNVGTSAITGPISFVTDNLPGGVTLIQGYRTTTCQAPFASPYASLNVPGGSLQPGQSVKMTLGFFASDSSQITYSTRILAGNAVR